jgi:hypothetical protein
VSAGSRSFFSTAGAFPSSTSQRAVLGTNTTENAFDWFGTIDEVRLTRLDRSGDFIRVDARARANQLTSFDP